MRELRQSSRLQEDHAVDTEHSHDSSPRIPKSGIPPRGRASQLQFRERSGVPNVGIGPDGERCRESCRIRMGARGQNQPVREFVDRCRGGSHGARSITAAPVGIGAPIFPTHPAFGEFTTSNGKLKPGKFLIPSSGLHSILIGLLESSERGVERVV